VPAGVLRLIVEMTHRFGQFALGKLPLIGLEELVVIFLVMGGLEFGEANRAGFVLVLADGNGKLKFGHCVSFDEYVSGGG